MTVLQPLHYIANLRVRWPMETAGPLLIRRVIVQDSSICNGISRRRQFHPELNPQAFRSKPNLETRSGGFLATHPGSRLSGYPESYRESSARTKIPARRGARGMSGANPVQTIPPQAPAPKDPLSSKGRGCEAMTCGWALRSTLHKSRFAQPQVIRPNW